MLLHGNGTLLPQLVTAIQAIRAMPAYRANPKPINTPPKRAFFNRVAEVTGSSAGAE